MRLKLSVKCNKKNEKLRNWLALFEEKGNADNISQIICGAVEYYAKTGKFYKVGSIGSQKRELEKDYQSIYVRDNSFVADWLAEQANQGEKIATLIKMIIESSLTEDEDWIIPLADLKLNVLRSLSEIKLSDKECSTFKEEKNPPIEQPEVIPEEAVRQEEKKERKPDLVDALIPGMFEL